MTARPQRFLFTLEFMTTVTRVQVWVLALSIQGVSLNVSSTLYAHANCVYRSTTGSTFVAVYM